jgi:hypothetical protein
LKVLKNGDPVPNIRGFQGQNSIEDFVAAYIVNGSIKLKENEAIYLFELGNTNLNNSGADFQDLVVLISVNGVNTPRSVVSSQDLVSSQNLVSFWEPVPSQELVSSQNLVSFWEPVSSRESVSSKETIYKLVIQHLGGDTINFKSPQETKVILQKGDEQFNLNFTELGVFKSGDRATLIPKEEGTNKQVTFSQGDQLVIKIVDLPSKCLICSRSITVK